MLEGKKTNIKMGGDFDPVPADKYTVQVADVDLIEDKDYYGQPVEKLKYQFVILSDKEFKVNGEKQSTRGRLLWHRFTQSLGKGSHLYKMAAAIQGRDLTKEEKEAFDAEALIGKQFDVMVNQKESKSTDAVYNNIIEYMKCAKELEPVETGAGKPAVVEQESKGVEDSAEEEEDEMAKLEREMEEKKKELEAKKAEKAKAK